MQQRPSREVKISEAEHEQQPPSDLAMSREAAERSLPKPSLLVRMPEAAHELQVTRQTIYNLISRGDLRAVHLGRALRIPRSELERLAGRGDDR